MAYFTKEQDEQWRAQQPKKMIVVKVVIKTKEGEVLLVKPSYKPTWQLPGGGAEAGESPATAAVREVYEETGISCVEADLRLVDTIFRPGQDILFLMYELPATRKPELQSHDDEIEAFEWVASEEVTVRLPNYYAEFWQAYLKTL